MVMMPYNFYVMFLKCVLFPQTLYLKNLSSLVKEEDLVSLFSKYQNDKKPRISYTLMQKGKMRGQAFINFHGNT